jgi:hypothetical protein
MKMRYTALFLAVLTGCAEHSTETPNSINPTVPSNAEASEQLPTHIASLEQQPSESTEEALPIHGQLDSPVEIGLLPELVPPHRDLKRMDIDQLSAAIKVATGSEGWVVNGADQFQALERTLGKPDYFDLTSEDLDPAALFQKFLDDAARSVCFELAETEVGIPENERVLMVHAGPEDTYQSAPEKIEANLSMLLKRYHGRHAEPGSSALQSFRWLYQSAEHVSQDPVKAWRTVCVGLIVHPAFYTY